MKKEQITIEQAQSKLLERIGMLDIGDEIYECAQQIVAHAIKRIEESYDITDKEELGSGEEWYDDVDEDARARAYDKIFATLMFTLSNEEE